MDPLIHRQRLFLASKRKHKQRPDHTVINIVAIIDIHCGAHLSPSLAPCLYHFLPN